MQRTIAVLAILLITGCGGMQQKEPVRLEPFAVGEALIKGEPLGNGLAAQKRSGEGLKLQQRHKEEQGGSDDEYPYKGLNYDISSFVRAAYRPGHAIEGEFAHGQNSMFAIGTSMALLFSLLSENAQGASALLTQNELADRVAQQNLQAWYRRQERNKNKSDVYGLFYRPGPDSNLLDMNFERLKFCKTHVWVKASHSHAKPGSDLNEDIWGVGLACRTNVSEKHRWWLSFDTLRNSHRLSTYLIGPIYQYELFEVYGFKFLPGFHAPFTYYNTPVRKNGEIVDQVAVKKPLLVPGVSIESGGPLKGIAIDIGRIPIADVTVKRLSFRGYILFD